jgi:hypothetical protein
MNAKLGSDGRLTLSGWLLNQLDSPDFAWRTKNSLLDEQNIRKTELNVNKNRPQDMAVSSSVEVNDYQFKSCILCQKSGLLTSGRSPCLT